MLSRSRRPIVFALGFTILTVCNARIAIADPPPSDAATLNSGPFDITSQMRATDARLDQKISISASRIYIGDLMERLSKQTGVDLSANDKDGAADVQIMVFLRDVPLSSALNAVRSMFSYKGAPWEWCVEHKAAPSGANGVSSGPLIYRLVQSDAARTLVYRLRAQVQHDFESEANRVSAALKMLPEQRQAAAKEDRDIANLLADGKRSEFALDTFAEMLSPEQQLSVLRGESKPQFPAANLSTSGSSFVNFVVNEMQTMSPPGSRQFAPLADSVRFFSMTPAACIAPTLCIGIGHLGAYGYLGGTPLETDCKARMQELWFLPGDAHTADADEKLMSSQAPPSSGPEETYEQTVTRQFAQLAGSTGASILVRMPTVRFPELGSPPLPITGGEKLAEFRKNLVEKRNLDSKWRDGVLLFNDMTWINKEGGQSPERVRDAHLDRVLSEPPWAPVRDFRAALAASPDGVPSLEACCRAATAMTVEQLKSLAVSDDLPMLIGVADWRDLYVAMGRSPRIAAQLQKPEGERLGAFEPEVLARYNIDGLQQAGVHPTTLHLWLEKYPYHGKTRGVVHIELLGSAGNTIEKSALSLDAIDIQERREREAKQRLGQSGPGTGS